MQNRNAEFATLHSIDKILPVFAKGSLCICVFLNLSSCFDTISREILYTKLYRYGVCGSELNSVKSYLNNRSQFFTYDGVVSTILPHNIGTIQGYKLGPKFFDIYTNDMNSLFENDENVMYADDTTVVYVGEFLSVLESNVNSFLVQFLDWCRFNKMALNPNKCEYMLLTNKCVAHEPNILLG